MAEIRYSPDRPKMVLHCSKCGDDVIRQYAFKVVTCHKCKSTKNNDVAKKFKRSKKRAA